MKNVLENPIPVDLGDGTNPIVMVDDEELDFLIVKRYHKLSNISNPLLHFLSGEAFLAFLETTKTGEAAIPAVVLMDINMPRMNGHETVRTLRADEQFRKVPVVMMLTSSDDPVDRNKADQVGANGYIVKPFKPQLYQQFFESLKAAS